MTAKLVDAALSTFRLQAIPALAAFPTGLAGTAVSYPILRFMNLVAVRYAGQRYQTERAAWGSSYWIAGAFHVLGERLIPRILFLFFKLYGMMEKARAKKVQDLDDAAEKVQDIDDDAFQKQPAIPPPAPWPAKQETHLPRAPATLGSDEHRSGTSWRGQETGRPGDGAALRPSNSKKTSVAVATGGVNAAEDKRLASLGTEEGGGAEEKAPDAGRKPVTENPGDTPLLRSHTVHSSMSRTRQLSTDAPVQRTGSLTGPPEKEPPDAYLSGQPQLSRFLSVTGHTDGDPNRLRRTSTELGSRVSGLQRKITVTVDTTQIGNAVKKVVDKVVDLMYERYALSRNDHAVASYLSTVTAVMTTGLLQELVKEDDKPAAWFELFVVGGSYFVAEFVLEWAFSLAETLKGVPVGKMPRIFGVFQTSTAIIALSVVYTGSYSGANGMFSYT
ncbi:hypothetical protein HDU96_001443 [Phlyctochytrium bullatum]|nr:hypothetical protein HDU96_001443 [Phlyctochytrium bullatum]